MPWCRAYEIEQAYFAGRNVLVTPEQAEQAVHYLCWSFGVDAPRVELSDKFDTYRGVYYPPHAGRPSRIRIGEKTFDWVVAHELGHHLDQVVFGGGGHDRTWAACYVYTVDALLNPDLAKGLNRAFALSGIRRRLGASLTPQALALAKRQQQVSASSSRQ